MLYKVGTRGSKLALTQTNFVIATLKKAYPEDEFEVVVLKTTGDKIQNKDLDQLGSKGVFVDEIENALRTGRIQMAVHSMKDMPELPSPGLTFAKPWDREDPRDALILRDGKTLEELPANPRIATGSKRRIYQLQKLRPDVIIYPMRGNVDTRIRKLSQRQEDGEFLDGIVIAAAGMKRLGRDGEITQYLGTDEMIPAPAQGTLALECREDNSELLDKLNALANPDMEDITWLEREYLKATGADCHMPIASYAERIPVDEAENEDVKAKAKAAGLDKIYRLSVMFGDAEQGIVNYAAVEGTEANEDMVLEAFEKTKMPGQGYGESITKHNNRVNAKVVLVGAGPGDLGLLTVRGRQCIEQADCIVYDRLIGKELLDLARTDCELIFVGKENHHHVLRQEEINELLYQKTLDHRFIVRLKGGDPYVFGRGGEEALYLVERGIAVEEVPGISSSVAALADAGVPITHRGLSKGFHVITAHSKKDEPADIDFSLFTDTKETCVFLMGLQHVKQIAESLIAAGRSADTPAAVISSGTSNKQRKSIGTLATIDAKAKADGLESPAIIVVGDVVTLADTLNFFERRPLFGKNYFVPFVQGFSYSMVKHQRSAEGNAFGKVLQELGANVISYETGCVTPLALKKEDLQQITDKDYVVFTSKNAINAFMWNLGQLGLDLRVLGRAKVAAVGKKSAEVLKSFGIQPDVVPTESTGEKLGALLKELIPEGGRVIWLAGKMVSPGLSKALANACELINVPCYENVDTSEKIDASMLPEIAAADGVVFTSGSSAVRTCKALSIAGGKLPENVFSIGPTCSGNLEKLGVEGYKQAETYNYDGLIKLMEA